MTRKLVAAALAANLALGTFSNSASAAVAVVPKGPTFGHGASFAPWIVIGCAGGIILSALAANARDNRQLTTEEAWSCGTLFWFSQPQTAKKKSHKKKH